MKNQIVALLIGVILLGSFSSFAQSDKAIKNGMNLNFVLGFPSSDYAFPEGVLYGEQYPVIFGLQVNSRWYIKPQRDWGIGVLVNFLDVNFAFKKEANDSYYKATLQAGGLGVGPVGTYKLADDMALDLYYNLRPTGMITAIVSDNNVFTEGDDFDIGLTHVVGVAYRYDILVVGVEFNFGKAGIWELSDGDFYPVAQKVGSTRIMLGVKF